eukprot:9473618-Pyramimonas_sp.AAC.1
MVVARVDRIIGGRVEISKGRVVEWPSKGLNDNSRLRHSFGARNYYGGESNFPVVERLNKGLTGARGPTLPQQAGSFRGDRAAVQHGEQLFAADSGHHRAGGVQLRLRRLEQGQPRHPGGVHSPQGNGAPRH